MKKEKIEFNGNIFIRYPESKKRNHRIYFSPLAGGKSKDIGMLHQEIWKLHFGNIPKGNIIHHKDSNPLNNKIENLECINKKQHAKYHKEEFKEKRIKHAKLIQPLTKVWHSSLEGKKWHSEHGKETWRNRKPIQKKCIQCGKIYLNWSNRKTDKFCSRLCMSRWNENHKRYHEDRQCIVCGKTFNIKKSHPQKTCSRKCSWVIRKIKINEPIIYIM